MSRGTEDARKNSERAAMMKKLGIVRNSGKCPMGCGAMIANGGPALLNHLGNCQGKRK